MMRETFFENFELFAEAPDAVAKLRDLVLDIAAHGKLVAQNPSEENGHALLVEMRKQSARPIEPDDSAKPSVELAELPSTWAAGTLGDVAEIVRGVSFPGSAKSKTRSTGLVACLRTASVQSEIDWDDLIYVSEHHVTRPDQWVARNDIIISMANSYELVGKVAIVREVPQKSTFGAFLAAIRPILIDPYFLLYVLRSPKTQAAFRENSSQTTNIANISLGRMRPMPFPIPPLAEQKRIVAKVDELMELCDRMEAQLQERDTRHAALARASLARFAEAPTPANLNLLFHRSYTISPTQLKRTILATAVEGRFSRADNVTRGSVGDYVSFLNGYAFESQWFTSFGTRLCRNTNIGHGRLDWHDCAHVDERTAGDFSRFALAAGDIVLSLDRPLISSGLKVARVTDADLPCLLLQRVARPKPKHDALTPDYLYLWLTSPAFTDGIDPGRSNGVPHISTRQVETMPFQFPDAAEQRRIVAKVEQLMALVDQLEQQLTASRAAGEKLLEALVAELTGTQS